MFKSIASEIRTGICVLNTHTHNGSFRAAISRSNLKSQSAMEYLMTYGWAILIIAVVLGALFSLGVFNGSNLAPKASPGECQVFRPNGPGTTMDINLAGECQGLEPQYVAQFNGHSSYVSIGSAGLPLEDNPRSFFAWVYWNGSTSGGSWGSNTEVIFGYGHVTGCSPYGGTPTIFIDDANVLHFDGGCASYTASPFTVTTNHWPFVGYTYNTGGNLVYYYDGQSNTITGGRTLSVSSVDAATIGKPSTELGNFFPGSIADVQIYNTSLDANQVQALYQEGIGGAPIDPMYLVGWWPLNGNSNDYSGNNNNGQAYNVIYTGSWTSGYSAP